MSGEDVGRHLLPLLVGAAITGEAAVHLVRGAQIWEAAYAALCVGVLWAWDGHHRARRAVAAGRMVQDMTWEPYVRPRRLAREDAAVHAALIEGMRWAEERVHAFAAKNRLQRLSLGTTFGRGTAQDARSVSHGDRALVWLGHGWFDPDHRSHLQVVLEHELAHIDRRDTGRRRLSEATALATTVFAAGGLPLTAAVLTASTVWFLHTMRLWWTELACDARALQVCGRTSAVAMCVHDREEAHTQPLHARLRYGLLSLRTHPPLRLRHWWARRAPLSRPLDP